MKHQAICNETATSISTGLMLASKNMACLRALLVLAMWCACSMSLMADDILAKQWGINLTTAEKSSKTEDGQIVKAGNGYVGIFSTGGGEKCYEGRVVMFAADGTKQWENVIQPSEYTTAQKVCVGSDGNIYVLGTTKVDNVTNIYVASYNLSGEARGVKLLDTTFLVCNIDDLQAYGDNVVAFYSGTNSANKAAYYATILDTNLDKVNEVERAVTGQFYSLENVLISGDWVLASSEYSYVFFNLSTGEVKDTKSGTYEGGCLQGGNFFLVQKMDKNYAVLKFSVASGEPKSVAITTLDFDLTQYYVRLFAGSDGNIYFVKISDTAIAKINQDGDVVSQKETGIDANFDSGFIYDMYVDSDGNMYFVGKSIDFKVAIAKLDKDYKVLSCQYSVVDDNYSYADVFEKQTSFVDGKLAVYAYLRPANPDLCNDQSFSLWTLGDEITMDWKYVEAAGKVPFVYPYDGVVDADGNSYITIGSNNQPRLAKYNVDGEQVWIANVPYIGTTAYAQNVVLLDNGKVVVAGFLQDSADKAAYQKEFVACFDTDGTVLWHKMIYDSSLYCYSYESGLVKADDGGVIMVSYALSEATYKKGLVIDKIDADGKVEWSKFVERTKNFHPNAVKLDQQGNVLVIGYAYANEDFIKKAAVQKFNQQGELLGYYEHTSSTAYEYSDAWTDANGKLYAVGYSENNGFYAVYDATVDATTAEGNEIVAVDGTESGYWSAVSGNDNSAVLIGSFATATSSCGLKMLSLSTSNPSIENWTSELGEASALNYCGRLMLDDDHAYVVGYKLNAGKSVENAMVCSLTDGSVLQEIEGDPINNTNAGYVMMKVGGTPDQFVVLSLSKIDQYIYMGHATFFKRLSTDGVSIQSVGDNDLHLTQDEVSVQGDNNTKLSLYSVNGQMLRSVKGTTLPINGLTRGVYVIKVQNGNRTKSIKIVK